MSIYLLQFLHFRFISRVFGRCPSRSFEDLPPRSLTIYMNFKSRHSFSSVSVTPVSVNTRFPPCTLSLLACIVSFCCFCRRLLDQQHLLLYRSYRGSGIPVWGLYTREIWHIRSTVSMYNIVNSVGTGPLVYESIYWIFLDYFCAFGRSLSAG